MKTAYIISTGSELLNGNAEDTNAGFLSRELSAAGLLVVGRETTSDKLDSIKAAWKRGLDLADLVISSGGLGPTSDDLTREALSEALEIPLVMFPEELEKIKEYFAFRKREMTEVNRKQAMFMPGSTVLPNLIGTAAGIYFNHGSKLTILLPGPPQELKPMFTRYVLDSIKLWLEGSGCRILSRTLKIIGLGESQVQTLIMPALSGLESCEIAYQATHGEVHVKLSQEFDEKGREAEDLDEAEVRIRKALGNNIFGCDEDTLAGVVIRLLEEKNMILATAESCTGGLIGKMLTDIPGSSNSFWGGVVSYSNEAKEKLLGVEARTLDHKGAVSSETAAEMSRGIRLVAGSDLGLGITGVAGPSGGTTEKPVGLVFVGLSDSQGEIVHELRLAGSRSMIRNLAARLALDMVRRRLVGEL